MTCPCCNRELVRCPYDFLGKPAYFGCECGFFTMNEQECVREWICRTIPVWRETGPI